MNQTDSGFSSKGFAAGLIVVHGNQPEALRDLMVSWIRDHPLGGLEDETILVQSNGVAQWLKLALARQPRADGPPSLGIAACLELSLPSRFVWQVYRAVLGPEAVPDQSPFDKDRLIWRLMRLLAQLPTQAEFSALQRFLGDTDDAMRRYQLADQIADLFDQYQVYRADWLNAWAEGQNILIDARTGRKPLDPVYCWQPALWRLLLEDAGQAQQTGRAMVHQAFLQKVAHAAEAPTSLPARIFVFGVSSLPRQSLEVLQALSKWRQVFLCVHNPTEHDWSESAHPLLTAWGKQGRDYIGLLNSVDDAAVSRQLFTQAARRIDLFHSHGSNTVLQQLQDDMRLMRSMDDLALERRLLDPKADRSIVFHRAHSPLRELEVLHDQLLEAFDHDESLHPRDVVVMVPDINAYAPYIEAVFGQFALHDPRNIPFSITDRALSQQLPMAGALDFLLAMTESRFTVTELFDLISVPAVRQRFGLREDQLPLVRRWMDQANIRWGLDSAHRGHFTGQPVYQNTWIFGLDRMLLGYAMGDLQVDQGLSGAGSLGWQGVVPFGEISGLEAAAIGALAALVDRLTQTLKTLAQSHRPKAWIDHLQVLLSDFFAPEAMQDKAFLVQAQQALIDWQEACDEAAFNAPLPLRVVATQWRVEIEKRQFGPRFFAGRVTFATLMPMRAIPFRRVCLLGLNDGEFPRTRPRADFDLMRLELRAGDRSRRDDDRYLFLEAVLSARDQLYISWVGHRAIDNTERTPSVLVAQLQDYIDAVWVLPGDAQPTSARASQGSVSGALTLTHRLQPFHRIYFNHAPDAPASRFFSYAHEWQPSSLIEPSVHRWADVWVSEGQGQAPCIPDTMPQTPLDLATLGRFLNDPVQTFFKERLGVSYPHAQAPFVDDEPFQIAGLDDYRLNHVLMQAAMAALGQGQPIDRAAELAIDRLRASGDLPVGAVTEHWAASAQVELNDLVSRYTHALGEFQVPVDPIAFSVTVPWGAHPAVIEDRIDQLFASDVRDDAKPPQCRRVVLTSRRIRDGKTPRFGALMQIWVTHLALQLVSPAPVTTRVIGRGGDLLLEPCEPADAQLELQVLVHSYRLGLTRPLPLALKTGVAWFLNFEDVTVLDTELAKVLRPVYEGPGFKDKGQGEVSFNPYLSRVYPTLEALCEDGAFFALAERLYAPFLSRLRVVVSQGGGEESTEPLARHKGRKKAS